MMPGVCWSCRSLHAARFRYFLHDMFTSRCC
jgi:hypothetical protein